MAEPYPHIPHGVRRYDNAKTKCRCDICRAGRREYDRARYASKAKPRSLVPWQERFERFVDRSGDCHVWLGYRTPGGYGTLQVDGKPVRAHRLSWLKETGQDPGEMFVCHQCDNPPCVRIEHLFLDSPKGNSTDMASKGRASGWHGLTLRGADNGNARLTWEQVDEIRDLYASKEAIQTELAARFGVSQSIISKIVRGETWVR